MKKNKNNPTDYSRLKEAVDESYRLMDGFRKRRREMIKLYTGSNYGDDNGLGEKTAINYIEMAINTYVQSFVARQDKLRVTTRYEELFPTADNFELALDHLAQKAYEEESIEDCILDAMFCMGIAKVALETTGEVSVNGVKYPVGEPYVMSVSLDDYVCDMNATRRSQMAFEGNRYWMDWETFKETPFFDHKDVQPQEKTVNTQSGGERTEALSKGGQQISEPYREGVYLEDIFLPYEKKVCTLVSTSSEEAQRKKPVRVDDWTGPACGPYHVLYFNKVPDQIIPSAPATHWVDLHEAANKIMKKTIRGALNQKTVFTYQGGSEDDVRRLVDANDQETVQINSPEKLQEIMTGGAPQELIALNPFLRDFFSWQGGNLDAQAGLSPQADTLGQDQMLQANANKRVAFMRKRVEKFKRSVYSSMAFYLWTDPLIEIPLTKRFAVPNGQDVTVHTSFSANNRQGEFLDYNITIDPIAYTHQTPEMKFNALISVMTQVVFPMMPMLQEEGLTIRGKKFMQILAKEGGLEELNEILGLYAGDQPISPQGQGAKQAPVTTRHNVRHNVSDASRSSRDDAMTRLFSGSKLRSHESGGFTGMN